ncbi:hypothetical protein AAFP30_24525 [Gordonia sp. CPCC 205515]|uniref:hypothetical protein n=1 Tax=Gordonia sp. CPCC 205515 TaxID=3140791 RepID=UPI003AF3F674
MNHALAINKFRARYLVPMGWVGYLAAMIGTITLGLTLILWAEDQPILTIICAAITIILFATASATYGMSVRDSHDPELQARKARQEHVAYVDNYPSSQDNSPVGQRTTGDSSTS